MVANKTVSREILDKSECSYTASEATFIWAENRTLDLPQTNSEQKHPLPKVSSGEESLFVCLFVFGATAAQWARYSSLARFLDHTQQRTTVGRTPLDE